MLTTIEAEIGIDGIVTLLEPVSVTRKSRAIVTILDSDKVTAEIKADERLVALHNLMRHAGAVDIGVSNDGDNDKIESALADDYGKDL